MSSRIFLLFELEATTKRCFKEGVRRTPSLRRRLTATLCRADRLNVRQSDCAEKLETTPAWRVMPEIRIEGQLAPPGKDWIAPQELRRWMKQGSIFPWQDVLATKAGNPERESADGYHAREILSTRTALAELMEQLHPSPVESSVGWNGS